MKPSKRSPALARRRSLTKRGCPPVSERLRARAGERLDEAILSRCRAANSSAQHHLEAASVFERAFRPGLLAAMLGCDEAAIVADIEELLSRRLLIEHAGELRFPHDL